MYKYYRKYKGYGNEMNRIKALQETHLDCIVAHTYAERQSFWTTKQATGRLKAAYIYQEDVKEM